MAVPKKKTSKSKRNMRRSHHKLPMVFYAKCNTCGAAKQPYHACLKCFNYK